VLPEVATVESGSYSVSRSLFVYVKKQHVGEIAGIAEFVRELTSEASIGDDGYNTAKGLLPLNKADRLKTKAVVVSLFEK
jgi:phosphate transport system substrate-binding protein